MKRQIPWTFKTFALLTLLVALLVLFVAWVFTILLWDVNT